MRRLLPTLCVVTLALCPRSSSAQPAIECDGPNCATFVRKGAPAPFTGQLLTEELSIDLALKATFNQRRYDVDLQHERELAAEKLRLRDQLHKIDQASCTAQLDALNAALDEQTQWYSQPLAVATLTVVLTVGALLGAGKLFSYYAD